MQAAGQRVREPVLGMAVLVEEVPHAWAWYLAGELAVCSNNRPRTHRSGGSIVIDGLTIPTSRSLPGRVVAASTT